MRGAGVAGESQGIPVEALVRDHSDTGFWHCGRLFACTIADAIIAKLEGIFSDPPFYTQYFSPPPP